MSKSTPIQWCDSTVNPVMGCAGCELFPAPSLVLREIDEELVALSALRWRHGDARLQIEALINASYRAIEAPGIGHLCEVTTTNIYHLRKQFADLIARSLGEAAGAAALAVIERQLICYAAVLNLNKGYSIANPS